ncbi:thiamine-phosphate kinase [Marinicella gelatinilytica]|uniref:thiamine-phosphate kinase n=1 Tax=Marinicella gelatinilytica TaxID=2996017 RepID=UPI002260B1ED|nr:thiamine-phosphate kinase [Marinicella gelatinilytica]MCX7545291.1 thiamine-phosphate kinase [Marinicella gelatinilytica]
MINEFDLIKQLQSLVHGQDRAVTLGIGDDAAVIDPALIPAGHQMVIATDTLVVGRHFKADDKPEDIGHKAIAVNLSDMAAMAAQPKWVLMNLTLPAVDGPWIAGFSRGVSGLLKKHRVELIGGDTTSGPLAIGFTVIGLSKNPKKRKDARAGDLVVVSGELGSAAFALNNPGVNDYCDAQLKRPQPRFDVAEAVIDYARAMIDVSDGLLADLGHICEASAMGAQLDVEKMPVYEPIKSDSQWLDYVLSGGDDYQLCFTIRPEDESLLPPDCTVIGHMCAGSGVTVYDKGQRIEVKRSGFDHFG